MAGVLTFRKALQLVWEDRNSMVLLQPGGKVIYHPQSLKNTLHLEETAHRQPLTSESEATGRCPHVHHQATTNNNGATHLVAGVFPDPCKGGPYSALKLIRGDDVGSVQFLQQPKELVPTPIKSYLVRSNLLTREITLKR